MLNSILNSALRGGLNNILGGARRRGGSGALGGAVGQAAIAAALGMLLRRGGGGRLLKVGGMAALGMMAYKAWQDFQARQGQAGAAGGTAPRPLAAPSDDDTPNPAHEQALLVAMIAAAKADGHVDANERAQLEQALRAGGDDGPADPELVAWFEAQLAGPLDVAEVARGAAGDAELASKIYLASVIVAGGGGTSSVIAAEEVYLEALGRALNLPAQLQASLRQQAAQLG